MKGRNFLRNLFPALAVLALPLLAFQQWRYTQRLAEDDSRRISSFLETGTRAVAAGFDKTISDLVHEIGASSPFDSTTIRAAVTRWETANGKSGALQNIWLVEASETPLFKPVLYPGTPDSAFSLRIAALARQQDREASFPMVFNSFFFEKQPFAAISPIQRTAVQQIPFAVAQFDTAVFATLYLQPLIDSLLVKPSGESIFWYVKTDSMVFPGSKSPLPVDSVDFKTAIGTVSSMRIVIMSSDDRDSVKFTWTKSSNAPIPALRFSGNRAKLVENTVLNVNRVVNADVLSLQDTPNVVKRFSGLPPGLPMSFSMFPSTPQLHVHYGTLGISGAVRARRNRDIALNSIIFAVLAIGIAFSIQSARRAEKLARRQMEFVSTVTHELRTPVAVIKSAAQNMSDGLVSSAERTITYGNLITDESRRLGDLIENVLAFSGLSSNAVTLKKSTFDAAALLSDVLSGLQSAAKAKNLTIQESFEKPSRLFADAHGVRLIFSNLIENAIKYSNPGGTVSILLKNEPGALTFAVHDHGMGISSADLPHIFEPFRRGKHAVEQQIKGSGLGLHLVKKYADLHGATISVESVIRTGSRFSVRFPNQNETAA